MSLETVGYYSGKTEWSHTKDPMTMTFLLPLEKSEPTPNHSKGNPPSTRPNQCKQGSQLVFFFQYRQPAKAAQIKRKQKQTGLKNSACVCTCSKYSRTSQTLSHLIY